MASYGLPYLSQDSTNKLGYKQSSVMSVCFPRHWIDSDSNHISYGIPIFQNTEF